MTASYRAFIEIKEKFNLVQHAVIGDWTSWTFPDAINAKGFVVEYKLGLRFAEKCVYDSKNDYIKFVGIVPIEPSNFDDKIKSLREMFDKASIKMKHYRMEKRIEKIEGDFE